MEQDKQLKQILLNSAEGASLHFTDDVMKKINALSGTSLYQPLVSPKLVRLFLFAFGFVTVAILGLCLIAAITPLHIVSLLRNLQLPAFSYNKILVFIIIFWAIFSFNAFVETTFRRRSSF